MPRVAISNAPTTLAATLLVLAILSAGCGPILAPPTPIFTPFVVPSPVVSPTVTAAAPLATATSTEVAQFTAEPTGPVIPHLVPGTPVTIRDIQMVDARAGWSLGWAVAPETHVLRTDDGGETWRDVTPPEEPADPQAIGGLQTFTFLDKQTGWVAYLPGRGEPAPVEIHFWRTTDGGETWERGQVEPTHETPEAPFLLFLDPSTGWFLTRHFLGMGHHGFTLLRTVDGGRTWERRAGLPETESTCSATGLAFADASTGWMTVDCPFETGGGFLLQVTQDGGATWQSLPLPAPGQPPDLFETASGCSTGSPHLFGPNAGKLVATCSLEEPTGTRRLSYLYATADAGATWQMTSFPGGELYLLDPDRGWALSMDIYWTEDGGSNWTKIKTVTWAGKFSFVSPEQGWAVATTVEETALVRTSDGGRTWELLEPVISP